MVEFGVRGLAILAVLAGCADKPEVRAPKPAIDYRLRISDDYRTANVHACFRGFEARRLVPGGQIGHALLANPVALPSGVALKHHVEIEEVERWGRTMKRYEGYLDLEGAENCVGYDISYAPVEKASGGEPKTWMSMMSRVWMWQPLPPPTAPTITVRVDAPKDATVFLPWDQRSDGTYAPPATTFQYVSHTTIGEVPVHSITVLGGRIDVAVPPGLDWLDDETLEEWVGGSARAVAGIYGQFPVRHLRVHLVPAGSWNGGAVGFGQVQRGGELSVVFYMNQGGTAESLERDWQAAHEFSHVGLPYITDAWCAEGFATYLASVALPRSGRSSEEAGWRWLARFLVDGASWNPGPYWRGATLAFLMDVEIRKRTRGRKSFDDAIRHLNRCCSGAAKRMSGAEVMRELDAWSGGTYLGQLVAEHKKSPGPAVEQTLDQLGVSLEDYSVSYDPEAPLSEVRAALLDPL